MQAAVVPAVRARWKIEDVPTSDPVKDVNRAYDRVAEGKVRFRAVITDA